VVKEVDRARTPEELAAYKEKLRQEAEAARQAEAQRKRDESLLASYANEDDIKRAFSQRTELIEQQIESSKLDIDMRTKSLDTMVTRAAESERAGRKVSDALKATIEGERAHIERQRAYIVEKQAEKAATEKEYQETLNAYRTARARLEAPRSPNAGNDPSQR
jgi:prophage tail gpP-like protein